METWKRIEGYRNAYEVSNLGRVRSCFDGKYRILKQMISAGRYNGYPMVTLYDAPQHGIKVKVHRLVAEAFIPNPSRLPVINHIDEDRTNNKASNLEWCTVQYNTTYGKSREKAVATWRKTKTASA